MALESPGITAPRGDCRKLSYPIDARSSLARLVFVVMATKGVIMKTMFLNVIVALIAIPTSAAAFAQTGGSTATATPGMTMQQCRDAMKGTDTRSCQKMMQETQSQFTAQPKVATHHATGVVKALNPAVGTVTFAHGPVADLHWPAMTMRFAVKDKTLFDKLAVERKVAFDFRQLGKDYVVTAVR